MKPYSYASQLRTVLLVEVAIVAAVSIVAFMFWSSICSDTLKSCIAEGEALGPSAFLLLSIFRPFVLTPHMFLSAIAGQSFGPIWGTILAALGGTISAVLLHMAGHYLGKRLVKPWLTANLPATWKFLRSQDYKIALAVRLVPIIPFDISSLLFGVFDFRIRRTALVTFVGSLPEIYVVAQLANPTKPLAKSALEGVLVFGIAVILPLLIWEFISRKRGASLWRRANAMKDEILSEAKLNNDVVKRQTFNLEKTPVLLLYGFFSSRRALTVLEKLLVARGHQVLSFNLGGLLGTFFTKSVLDTAVFIDYKLKRQIDRHGFKKFHVVAHSKGGFVALWWVLKLGGHNFCDKVITMGTPFAGTRWTYLALITPLGFFWRDMWQMRPRSSFLRYLAAAEIPENVTVHCLHSVRDTIAKGEKGLFKPTKFAERVYSVPMDKVSHFEFLYRRDVADRLSAILGDGTPVVARSENGPEITPIGPIAPAEPSDIQMVSTVTGPIDSSGSDLPFSSIENSTADDVEAISLKKNTHETFEKQKEIKNANKPDNKDDDDRSA